MHEERDQHSNSIAPPIRIVTLGTFLILYQDQGEWKPITDADLAVRGSSLTFVKLLVSSSPSMESYKRAGEWERHEVSRDLVIDALWPGAKALPADPDNAISVAKSALNRALRPYTKEDVVLLTDGTDRVGYRLNTRVVTVDVDEFERLVHQASDTEGRGEGGAAQELWEKAYRLIQGEYLPHDQYNDWSQKRRERLHSRYRLLLHHLSRLYIEQSRMTEAIELLHPHVLAYPTDLDGLCVLLPLLTQQSRFEEALQMIQTYRETLKEEEKAFPLKMREIEVRLKEAQGLRLTELSLLSLAPGPLIVLSGDMFNSSPEPQTFLTEAHSGNGLCLSPSYSSPFPEMGELATWFDLKQKLICALVLQWCGRAMDCDMLQVIIDQELWMLDMVKTLYTQEAYTLSRRRALLAIAALPAALLAAPGAQRRDSSAEEFLPACTASLSACWQLMNGKEITAVEREVSRYLPALINLATGSSMYRESAAFLASQGCLLLSLTALHHYSLQGRLSYCQQAVKYARTSGKPPLIVRTLVHLGDAFHTNGRLPEMLQAYQEAALFLDQVPPRLQSHAWAESAHAYALNGKVQETLRCLGKARTVFTGETNDVSSFLLADTGLFSLILYEGMAYLDLGRRYEEAEDRTKARTSYSQAVAALAQIDGLPATAMVPERVRLEIINLQTLAAVKVRDLDRFQQLVLQGIEGAKALQSEKRRQEAILNWKAARQVWPKETKVLEVVDAIL